MRVHYEIIVNVLECKYLLECPCISLVWIFGYAAKINELKSACIYLSIHLSLYLKPPAPDLVSVTHHNIIL